MLKEQLQYAYANRFAYVPDYAPVLKFDPNQPRDEDGRWTGGGGAVVRELSPAAARRKDAELKDWMHRMAAKQREEDALAKEIAARPQSEYTHNKATHAEVKARLSKLVPKVSIAKKQTAVTAASHAAEVLERMHAQGYLMPTSLSVRISTTKRNIYGQVKTPVNATSGGAMAIQIPENIPDDANLDHAVEVAFGSTQIHGVDKFVSKTMNEIIVHEMGHVQTDVKSGKMNHAAMSKVSWYATTNLDEFVAEAFSRLYRGETLAEDSMRLYREVGGPEIRP